MGRRAGGAAAKAKAKGGKRNKRGSANDDDYQQPGKLMLNNPLIPPEMDEDIDDDLAFDSEDEALFGHFFNKSATDDAGSSGKKTKLTKKAKKGGRGGADDDLRGEEFDAIDRAEKRGKKRGRGGSDEDDFSDSDDNELYNYREEGQSSGDDGDDYVDLSDMFDMAVGSAGQEAQKPQKKKKAAVAALTEDMEGGERAVGKKRRGAKVTEEPESLYGMAASGVDGAANSFSSALRTFVKGQESDNHEEESVRQRLRDSMASKHNLLSLDADDPTKARVTRREVRAVVEKNLEKYKPLLRELNTAKHVQFPMKPPDSVPTPSSIGGIVASAEAKFGTATPSSGAAGKLASRMNELLSRAGLSRKQQQQDESSAGAMGNHVKFDDDDDEETDYAAGARGEDGEAPSRSYVAKLKALMSYEMSRRKRFNRIKSKTYRRILRKEKDRERERREKAFELLHPELARKRLAEKLLRARAEERVTQKHKNTSAWVKRAKRFADFDTGAKDAIDEQHAIHQRLMQKMEQDAGEDNYGRYLAEDDDGASAISSEEERVVDELFAATAKQTKEGKTASAGGATSLLWKSVEDAGDDGAAHGGVGVTDAMRKARKELGEMKFMKTAREREEKEYAEQVKTLQDDIRRYQSGEDVALDSDADDDEKVETSSKPVAKARMSFKANGKGDDAEGSVAVVEAIQRRKQKGLRADAEEEEDEGDSVSDEVSLGTRESDDEQEESWQTDSGDEGDAKTKQKKAASPVSKKTTAKKTKSDKSGEFAGLRAASADSSSGKKKKTTSTRIVVKPGANVLQTPTEVVPAASMGGNEQEEDPTQADDLRLHQEYLISRAFAHDDVDEEFLKDKEAQVEAIMKPEDRNDNLPGWGEWGGENEELNKRHQEKLSHTKMQKQIERSFLMKSRADAALDHVIINHDGVELVPDRMTLHMVPRPFSNPQEFARSMRQPLGPEWSSAMGFKEGVQPRVEVRQGHSVLPLDISLRGKRRATTKRRKTDVSK